MFTECDLARLEREGERAREHKRETEIQKINGGYKNINIHEEMSGEKSS